MIIALQLLKINNKILYKGYNFYFSLSAIKLLRSLAFA